MLDVIPAEDIHLDFIYSTWLKNYRYGSYFAKRIRKDIYYKNHHAIVERILKDPKVRTYVACESHDKDFIMGYVVYIDTEPKTIHYLYVKDNLRRLKIASTIIDKCGLDLNKCHFTHWTYDCDWIVGKKDNEGKFPGMVYDPYNI